MSGNEQFESSELVDGTQIWTSKQTATKTPLSGLSDTKIVSPTDGQVLSYSAADGKWENESQTDVDSLSGLTDTDITSPSNGQVLTYESGTGKWQNETPAGGSFYTSLGTATSVGGETQLVVSGWAGTYKFYKIILVTTPLSSHTLGSQWNLSFNGDTEQDGNGSYRWGAVEWNGGGASFASNVPLSSYDTIQFSIEGGVYQEARNELEIWNLVGNQKTITWKGDYVVGTFITRDEGTGYYTNSAAITSVKARTHRGNDTMGPGTYLEVIGYN